MIPSRAPGVVLPSPSAQLPPPLLALAHCNVQTLAALSCHALSSVLSCALVVLWPSVHTSCSSLVLGPHALASLSHLPSHAVMLVSRYTASATCTTVHTYSWCNMYHVENDVDLLHEPPLKTVCEVRRQPIRYYTAKTFLTPRKSSQNAKTPSFAVKVPLYTRKL